MSIYIISFVLLIHFFRVVISMWLQDVNQAILKHCFVVKVGLLILRESDALVRSLQEHTSPMEPDVITNSCREFSKFLHCDDGLNLQALSGKDYSSVNIIFFEQAHSRGGR